MAKKEERSYSVSDTEMLEAAETMHVFFQKDEKDFRQFNPVLFTHSFKDYLLKSINEARETKGDEVVIDEVAKETQDVELLMKDGRSQYQDVKYFIEKAFPNNKPVWNQFGVNDYEKAKNNPSRMVNFLETLYKESKKYQDKLLAAGCTLDKIERIEQLRNDLRCEKIEQQEIIKTRPVLTQERVRLMNKVWSYLSEISTAAKRIYKDNYAKLEQYTLPANTKPGSSSNTEE